MPSAWISHVKSVYAAKKKKNPSYRYGMAMKDAKASWHKKGSAAKTSTEEQAAPKKRRRKKKKPNEEPGAGRRRVVAKQHTAGLGNVEEGRLAEKATPATPAVKQRRKKRPQLGSQYKTMN